MSTTRRRQLARRIRSLDPSALPARLISGSFYRQNGPRRRADDLPHVARAEGRYHTARGEPPMYASSSQDASWGEMFRHHVNLDLSPFEVRRRMSRLEVRELPVLDLTDPQVRRLLGITTDDLVANDYIVCQAINQLIRRRPDRFGGILAPSAAIRSEQTLAIFQDRLSEHVIVASERVARPPRRLFGLFELIIDTLPAPLRRPLRYLAGQIQSEWQKLS